MSVLQLDQATIRFGGLVAVNSVSFTIEKGDLFGLIGPNGAGKTTCFNLITGVYRPTSGTIRFQNKVVSGPRDRAGVIGLILRKQARVYTPPNKIAKLGICRTFQNIRLFPALSVLENVVVAGALRSRSNLVSALAYMPGAIKDTNRLRGEAMDLLRVLDLEDVADTRSADLPYGKQRRLEIARAMATKPELLLLDEPAAGMNPYEKEDLMNKVKKLRDEHGKTVLVIEHDMRFVMNLCEKIVVLDHGEEIAQGPPAEIRNDPKVIEAYLGEAV